MDRRVELVRLPAPDRLYDREAEFGRDVSSVFRGAAQAQPAALNQLSSAAPRFVTETELEQLKALRGGALSLEDGTASLPDRPLADILAENTARKQEEFEAGWKLMKQGGNKPLEEEEAAFLSLVQEESALRERMSRSAMAREVEAFQLQRSSAVRSSAVVKPRPAQPAPSGAAAVRSDAKTIKLLAVTRVRARLALPFAWLTVIGCSHGLLPRMTRRRSVHVL